MKKLPVITISLLLLALSPLTAGGKTEQVAQPSNTLAWVEATLDNGLPGVNPLKVSGNIITAGSSTVYPLSERMAERFKQEGYSGTITIDSIGSGAGVELSACASNKFFR